MFKGYKTISIALTFLLAVLSSPDVQSIIATYPKSFGSAVAILIVVLRIATTTPIFGINSITVEKDVMPAADQKYPRLDPKP